MTAIPATATNGSAPQKRELDFWQVEFKNGDDKPQL
jgi:hypothetical protein